MSEYEVKDYGAFSDAVTSTKTFGTSISGVQDAVNGAKTTLSDTSIFQGPAQENCMSVLSKIETDFSTITTNYQTIENYLTGTSTNYQTGDTQAASTVNSTDTSAATAVGQGSTKMSIPSDPTVAAKKKEWLKDVDDKSQYTYYQGNDLYSRRNKLEVFDNTTGESWTDDGGEITLKPGETRVLTIKLPTDTGAINQITRTTADGSGAYRTGKIVTARSDIDPDPNNIEWVRLVESKGSGTHSPSDTTLLHNNNYDWIITAHSNGTVTASQTVLWSTDQTKGRNLKAMVDVKVHVQS